ncbi:Bcr/CflA family efflux MFS transporter [Actinoplanes sp. NPDC048967]|uniref:Bcr/CflA family efflux MFS transporter n=1 Tax=Actinoplanes sp. NPDC048967 TaxID=3155269 RepID=UPI0033DA68DA
MTALPVLVLGLLAALGPLSIDLYLPAFPALRQDLDTSAGAVQLTLAGMTLGLALGQAVVGAWSDRVGRRKPLLLSTVLHLLATIGCALAPSVEVLATCRFVQGVGAAGSAVLVLAIIRDVADGRTLVVLLSRVTLVETVAPLLAPVAGAELLDVAGWRGIFGLLAAGSATLLVAALLIVPETAKPPPEPVPLRARLRAVGADHGFRLATVSGSMTFAGVYAYVAASPTLLREVYGLSARTYAVVFLLNSLGLVAGVQLSSMLTRRAGPGRVLAGCTAVTLAAAAAIVPLQWAHAGLAGLLPCLWLFVAGCGGCFAGAAGLALHGQGARSGTATSVYGFATFAVAGLVSPLAGLAGITDATPLAVVLLATATVSLTAAGLLLRAGVAQATSVAVPPVTRSSSA